jgi:hypothetical protein
MVMVSGGDVAQISIGANVPIMCGRSSNRSGGGWRSTTANRSGSFGAVSAECHYIGKSRR